MLLFICACLSSTSLYLFSCILWQKKDTSYNPDRGVVLCVACIYFMLVFR